ncbi:MAG: anti-sigma factor [Candidatus Peribacteraceae bacterium]|nr:anti-sigma factor [Candidatus Peribacteraceae bacterium]MDD5742636.1 anti-sigma factor [Candidatus Peribacteraceae bacterium]
MKRLLFLLGMLPLLLTGCGSNGGGETLGSESFRYNIPSGAVQDLRFGKEVFFAYGPISGTKEVPSNGLAKVHVFEKGVSLHTLQVNIALPKDGYFYEGWLLNPATNERISTGHLKSLFGDVRHNLDHQEERDLREFTKVIITLEKDDGNPAPGTQVATGTLKELKRD